MTFTRGMLAVQRGAREAEMGLFEYIRKGPDPMGTVLCKFIFSLFVFLFPL